MGIAYGNDTTVQEIWDALGVNDDVAWLDKMQALADVLAPEDQEFEDWLGNGHTMPEDTMGQIWADWAEYEDEDE